MSAPPIAGIISAVELSNPEKRRGYRRTAQLALLVGTVILRELEAGDPEALARIATLARALRGEDPEVRIGISAKGRAALEQHDATHADTERPAGAT